MRYMKTAEHFLCCQVVNSARAWVQCVCFLFMTFSRAPSELQPLEISVSVPLTLSLCQAESQSGSSSFLNCCFRSLYLQIKASRPTVAPPTHTPQEKVPKSMTYSEVFSDVTGIKGLWLVLIQFCILTGGITECQILVPMKQLTSAFLGNKNHPR